MHRRPRPHNRTPFDDHDRCGRSGLPTVILLPLRAPKGGAATGIEPQRQCITSEHSSTESCHQPTTHPCDRGSWPQTAEKLATRDELYARNAHRYPHAPHGMCEQGIVAWRRSNILSSNRECFTPMGHHRPGHGRQRASARFLCSTRGVREGGPRSRKAGTSPPAPVSSVPRGPSTRDGVVCGAGAPVPRSVPRHVCQSRESA